jgi:4-hydroxythreonine-4-phosphate dehydrogenase
MRNNQSLIISCGDPNGIGLECIAKALKSNNYTDNVIIILFGPLKLIQTTFKNTANTVKIVTIDNIKQALKNQLNVIDIKINRNFVHLPGIISKEAGHLAYEALIQASRSCHQHLIPLVTAPISKEAIYLAGIKQAGQTEILQTQTQSKHICMSFFSPKLNIALQTSHIPLSQVPAAITTSAILTKINLIHDSFTKKSHPPGHIYVSGLNPHAGENGNMGHEEQTIIKPAIDAATTQGISVSGPYPGDTIYKMIKNPTKDIVLAMYHDQALAPLKLVAFDNAVNTTLGLPFLRTSPDHGTAMDIAGKNKANPSSTIAAIELALKVSKQQ